MERGRRRARTATRATAPRAPSATTTTSPASHERLAQGAGLVLQGSVQARCLTPEAAPPRAHRARDPRRHPARTQLLRSPSRARSASTCSGSRPPPAWPSRRSGSSSSTGRTASSTSRRRSSASSAARSSSRWPGTASSSAGCASCAPRASPARRRVGDAPEDRRPLRCITAEAARPPGTVPPGHAAEPGPRRRRLPPAAATGSTTSPSRSAPRWLVQVNFWLSMASPIAVVAPRELRRLLADRPTLRPCARGSSSPSSRSGSARCSPSLARRWRRSFLQGSADRPTRPRCSSARPGSRSPGRSTRKPAVVRHGRHPRRDRHRRDPHRASTIFFVAQLHRRRPARARRENPDRAQTLGVNVGRRQRRRLDDRRGALRRRLRHRGHGHRHRAGNGANTIVPYLAAAVIGGLVSIPVTAVAAVTLGIVDQSVRWSIKTPGFIDGLLLVIIVVVLLVQRARTARADTDDAGWKAAREMRPIPDELRDRSTSSGAGSATCAVRRRDRAPRPPVGAVAVADQPRRRHAHLRDHRPVAARPHRLGRPDQPRAVRLRRRSAPTSPRSLRLAVPVLAPRRRARRRGASPWSSVLPALRLRGLHLAISTLAFAVAITSILLNPRYFGQGPARRLRARRSSASTSTTSAPSTTSSSSSWRSRSAPSSGMRRSRTARALIACRGERGRRAVVRHQPAAGPARRVRHVRVHRRLRRRSLRLSRSTA